MSPIDELKLDIARTSWILDKNPEVSYCFTPGVNVHPAQCMIYAGAARRDYPYEVIAEGGKRVLVIGDCKYVVDGPLNNTLVLQNGQSVLTLRKILR
jgi:hypothetical protein